MEPRLVTLSTYRTAFPAELAKDALAHAGITAFVADENIVTTDWLLGNAVGGVKLEVAEGDAPAATEILERFFAEQKTQQQAREADADTDAKCLSCGADMDEAAETCAACGWSFVDEGDQPE